MASEKSTTSGGSGGSPCYAELGELITSAVHSWLDANWEKVFANKAAAERGEQDTTVKWVRLSSYLRDILESRLGKRAEEVLLSELIEFGRSNMQMIRGVGHGGRTVTEVDSQMQAHGLGELWFGS